MQACAVACWFHAPACLSVAAATAVNDVAAIGDAVGPFVLAIGTPSLTARLALRRAAGDSAQR